MDARPLPLLLVKADSRLRVRLSESSNLEKRLCCPRRSGVLFSPAAHQLGGGCWGTHTPMTSVTCTSPGLSLAGWDICSTCGCGGHPEGPPHAPLPGPSCLHPDIVRTTPRSEPVRGLPRGTFPARPVIFKPWVHSPSEHVDVNKTEGSKLK